MESRNGGSAVASVLGALAMVISAVALVLAWVAFNNTSDENLEAKIQNQMQDTVRYEQPMPQQPESGTWEQSESGMTPDTGANTTPDSVVDPEQDEAVMPENN